MHCPDSDATIRAKYRLGGRGSRNRGRFFFDSVVSEQRDMIDVFVIIFMIARLKLDGHHCLDRARAARRAGFWGSEEEPDVVIARADVQQINF